MQIGKTYTITLTGVTPLLLHHDNIEWAEKAARWSKDPDNKKQSVAGDDRTPAWTWIGYCYDDGKHITIDSDNLMTMFRDAGKKCPAAKGRGSLKALTQSGIVVNEIGWPIQNQGRFIDIKSIHDLASVPDFAEHAKHAEALGFELFVKRARIGQAKHIRVRPRFNDWSAQGTVTILDDSITQQVLETLLDQGGRLVGLGDWRPGSPASGRFGMFEARVSE